MRNKEAQADLKTVRSLLDQALETVNWNYRHLSKLGELGDDRDTWSALSGHIEMALQRISTHIVEDAFKSD